MSPTRLRDKNALHLSGVRKHYGGTKVIDNVDLSISPGALCTLVGPSGCGKSTLFRLILGEERPTDGTVYIDGVPAGIPDSSRGVVYQKYSLFPHMTVWQNVTAAYRLNTPMWKFPKVSGSEVQEAERFLERAGMLAHKDKYPHQLSGGQQQRVAIIQAMLAQPKILLMDEPFSALDKTTREGMQMLLLELHEETGMTILFVTHDLMEATYLGTRIVALSQYYTHEDDESGLLHGSRIVFDEMLRPIGQAIAPDQKESPEAIDIRQRLQVEAFDQAHLQRVHEFTLRHPNSFSKVLAEVQGAG